jgi:hypothetical protein
VPLLLSPLLLPESLFLAFPFPLPLPLPLPLLLGLGQEGESHQRTQLFLLWWAWRQLLLRRAPST